MMMQMLQWMQGTQVTRNDLVKVASHQMCAVIHCCVCFLYRSLMDRFHGR